MILDIIIVFVALCLIALGIYKGFSGLLFGFFSIFMSLFIAFFLSEIVAARLYDTSIGDKLREYITSKVAKVDLMNSPIIFNDADEKYYILFGEEQRPLKDAFKIPVLNSILAKYAANLFTSTGINNMTLAQKFVPSIAMIILSFISGLILFFVSTIVFKIFSKLSENWKENPNFERIDRVLGAIIGLFVVFMFSSFLMLGAKYAEHKTVFKWLNNASQNGLISKLMLKHNFLGFVLEKSGVNAQELFLRYFPIK